MVHRLLACLDDEGCEEQWYASSEAIWKMESFDRADALFAEQVLQSLSEYSNAGESALRVLWKFYGTPEALERGLIAVLQSRCKRKLDLLCKHSRFLPPTLSNQFCSALAAAVGDRANDSVDFMSELRTLRPLVRRCKRSLQVT